MADPDPIAQLVQETRAYIEMRPAPDFVSAVMGQVEQLEPEHVKSSRSRVTRFVRGLWTPRLVTFEFRPAYALVAATCVLLAAAVSLHPWSPADSTSALATTQPVSERVYVQFRLQTADATDVRLAGSFTHWQPEYQLHETAPGLWTVTLPLAPGVHDYAFIVDGRRWVTDPYAPAVQDGFGGTNSRIMLVSGGNRHL
jgi:hypothetical protein